MSAQRPAQPGEDGALGESEAPRRRNDSTPAARSPKKKTGGLLPKSGIGALVAPWIMIFAVLGAAIGGIYLDRWLRTTPWLTISLIVLGVVGGGVQAYRSIMKALRDK